MPPPNYVRRANIPAPVEEHAAITRLDDATFSVDFTKAFCVGTVPQGGYVLTTFLKAAEAYLSPRNQPDTISGTWSFLNRTQEGPGILKVEEIKKGRAFSFLHITLYQDGLLAQSPWISPDAPKLVVGYMTNGNVAKEQGISLPTGWTLSNEPPPVNLNQLTSGEEPNWRLYESEINYRVPMIRQVTYYTPRRPRTEPGIIDFWLRTGSGEPFFQTNLPWVADVGPPVLLETYKDSFPAGKEFWYPTISLSYELKKQLPKEGVEWLRMRTTAKTITNGRNDCEMLIFDASGDLVAIVTVVALAIDASRNVGSRVYTGEERTKGKL